MHSACVRPSRRHLVPRALRGGRKVSRYEAAEQAIVSAVRVPAGRVELAGDLALPERVRGIVLFAHGAAVAAGMPAEPPGAAASRAGGDPPATSPPGGRGAAGTDDPVALDIAMLADRVIAAVDWLGQRGETRSLPVAVFGASTGAAAALVTAVDRRTAYIWSSRAAAGPDLAGDALPRVSAPTPADRRWRGYRGVRLTDAAAQMSADVDLQIVSNATHLFAGPAL